MERKVVKAKSVEDKLDMIRYAGSSDCKSRWIGFTINC